MANDTFQKFKSTFNRGVATISVKTSSSLEKAKIKTHIESIEKEIEQLMKEIGNSAYEIWENEDEDFSVLSDKCLMIKEKRAEIVQLNKEYEAIDEKEGQILGTTSEENNKNLKEAKAVPEGSVVCPNCGVAYIQGVKFCRKCGQKLID